VEVIEGVVRLLLCGFNRQAHIQLLTAARLAGWGCVEAKGAGDPGGPAAVQAHHLPRAPPNAHRLRHLLQRLPGQSTGLCTTPPLLSPFPGQLTSSPPAPSSMLRCATLRRIHLHSYSCGISSKQSSSSTVGALLTGICGVGMQRSNTHIHCLYLLTLCSKEPQTDIANLGGDGGSARNPHSKATQNAKDDTQFRLTAPARPLLLGLPLWEIFDYFRSQELP